MVSIRKSLVKLTVTLSVISLLLSTYFFWRKTYHSIAFNQPQKASLHNRLEYLWSALRNDETSINGYKTKCLQSVSGIKCNDVDSNQTKTSVLGNYKAQNFFIKCPKHLLDLQGKLEMPDYLREMPPSLVELESRYQSKSANAKFNNAPTNCEANYKVAIIIPLRGRELQLRSLLSHMHPIWQRQQLDYTVYTITQAGNQLFNRAKLMNIGFTEAIKERKYDCFVFHDVDLLLENDECLYWCPQDEDGPRHLSTYLDKREYKVHSYNLEFCVTNIYKSMPIEVFGGVSMFTEKQFTSVNGFSNLYWGWGSEDDDLFLRAWRKGYKVHHDSNKACSFRMMYHGRERRNRKNIARRLLLKHALSRQYDDGLNSLRYSVLAHNKTPIYTSITVDIGRPSARLREMAAEFIADKRDINRLSCLESLLWMSQSLIRKRGNNDN